MQNPNEIISEVSERLHQWHDFIKEVVLHKLTTAIMDGYLSVEEAKKLLFRKGRVEFKGAVTP